MSLRARSGARMRLRAPALHHGRTLEDCPGLRSAPGSVHRRREIARPDDVARGVGVENPGAALRPPGLVADVDARLRVVVEQHRHDVPVQRTYGLEST